MKPREVYLKLKKVYATLKKIYADKQIMGIVVGLFVMFLGFITWPALLSLMFWAFGSIIILSNLIFNRKGDRWLIPGWHTMIGKNDPSNRSRKKRRRRRTR
jgi:hypothetical protein